MKKYIKFIIPITLILVGIQSCKNYYFRNNYNDANSVLHETKNLETKPFLKAHLKNGDICILEDTWQIDTLLNNVTGQGFMYDFNRLQKNQGTLTINIDSVAIFETNTKLLKPESSRITALSIMTGVDVIVSIICLTNPKACFGSCPTFYYNENDNFHYSNAEGFSNAIAPSLEYADIDALKPYKSNHQPFSLTMKNEALETHCVKNVNLLAYPIQDGERVYQSPNNEFYLCQNNYSLLKAEANEGNVVYQLKYPDLNERFSSSDSDNLSTKEELFFTFDETKDVSNLGLILNFRQTLMTTYFIYSAMGYMGDEVGDMFAKIETNQNINNQLKNGIKKELGEIEIYVWDETLKKWEFQNSFYETGPIAINKQIIPLKIKNVKSDLKIKMILNKGLWRLDYVALTNIKKQVKPTEIFPSEIYNKGKLDTTALKDLNNPEKYLISMPGSEFKFNFQLPESNTNYELFLNSKGYYLEWMRQHWIKDKDLLKLNQMVTNPKQYLKDETFNYKMYETTMEQEFWNSKIDTKSFAYYEK